MDTTLAGHAAIQAETFTVNMSLQFGSQIYSYASIHENSGSESSGGQGMEKTGENFGVEPDESQK